MRETTFPLWDALAYIVAVPHQLYASEASPKPIIKAESSSNHQTTNNSFDFYEQKTFPLLLCIALQRGGA